MNEVDKLIQNTVYKISDELKNVVGVDAIVFGGSRVIGTNAIDSNVDIGVYYVGDGVLDVEGLNIALTNLDDLHRTGLLAFPGSWGPWLNGGACIQVNNLMIDISLRSVTRVDEVIQQCNLGNITVSYQFGHPFGFVSSMYLAEIDLCQIFFDKRKNIANLKKKVRPFNKIYKKASINHFLWEAEYSSKSGRRCVLRKDVVTAAGALYKSVNSLLQVLYSFNDEFLLNEKGAIDRARKFKKVPNEFINNVESIFIALDKENIANAFDIIDYYVNEFKIMLQSLAI